MTCAVRTRIAASLTFAVSSPALAQPVMENLGRGVVAVRTAETAAYIGWRLLATDPAAVAFNLYRAAGRGEPVRLNKDPITSTTDFVDSRRIRGSSWVTGCPRPRGRGWWFLTRSAGDRQAVHPLSIDACRSVP